MCTRESFTVSSVERTHFMQCFSLKNNRRKYLFRIEQNELFKTVNIQLGSSNELFVLFRFIKLQSLAIDIKNGMSFPPVDELISPKMFEGSHYVIDYDAIFLT